MLTLSEGRRRYISATYQRSGLEIKHDQRNRLVQYCYQLFRSVEGKIKVLTLPGPWLHFEHMLIKPTRPRGWWPHFTCCENNKEIFSMLAINLPIRQRKPLNVKQCAELDCHVVTNKKDFVCLNCDVADLVKVANGPYRMIWLDFCGPITPKNLAALKACQNLWATGPCLFAITFMLARETGDMVRLLDEEANGDRMAFLKKQCLDGLPGSALLHSERYVERASPMAHIIVWRNP